MKFKSEDKFQVACVDYLRKRDLYYYHVPNGMYSNRITVSRFKRMGMKPGLPDIIILDAFCGYHGLVVELKCGRNKLTDSQLRWLGIFRSCNWGSVWLNDFDDFKFLIESYVGGFFRNSEGLGNFYFTSPSI